MNSSKNNPASKSPLQLQNAFNEFLTSSEFHYSIFYEKFQSMWDFKSRCSDLKYPSMFIKQELENNKAKLTYTSSTNRLKRIEKYGIRVCASIAIVYILAIAFEIIALNWLVSNYNFNEPLYNHIKLIILIIMIILLPIAALLGSKATTAIGLKKVFDIQDKVEQ